MEGRRGVSTRTINEDVRKEKGMQEEERKN